MVHFKAINAKFLVARQVRDVEWQLERSGLRLNTFIKFLAGLQ